MRLIAQPQNPSLPEPHSVQQMLLSGTNQMGRKFFGLVVMTFQPRTRTGQAREPACQTANPPILAAHLPLHGEIAPQYTGLNRHFRWNLAEIGGGSCQPIRQEGAAAVLDFTAKQQKSPEITGISRLYVFFWCPGEDSNLHASQR